MAQSRRIRTFNEVRMLLLGGTGNGKSSLGNTILGRKFFEALTRNQSVTKVCKLGELQYEGKLLRVVDSPGFFDTKQDNEVIEDEISKAYQTLAPGPHAFLIVQDVRKRFTDEQQRVTGLIKKIFGDEVFHYCIVVFTGIDQLVEDDRTIEDYIEEIKGDPLGRLLNESGNRYVGVNNRGSEEHKLEVLNKLLSLIQQIETKNNGFYVTDKFAEVDKVVKELKEDGHVLVAADGSIFLNPEVKKIVGTFLRRTIRRHN